MPFTLTPLAAKLIVIGVFLIAGAIGVKWWLAKHDAQRDLEFVTAANERTEETATELEERAGVLDDEITSDEWIVETGRQKFETQYEEIRRESPSVTAATDMPVPDELRRLANERYEERQRLDRDGAGGGEDGGTTLSRVREWFQSDERSEDDGRRLPSGSESGRHELAPER